MSNNKNAASKPSEPQTPAKADAPPTAPTSQPEPAAATVAPENAPQAAPSPEPSHPADVVAAATHAAPPTAPKVEAPYLVAYVGDVAEVTHRGYHFPRNTAIPVSVEVWAKLESHPSFRVSRGDGDV
ncbi:hypothetical protein [Lysobacter sp. Hz 25]|uniref:hypothetical protein n=1 Tax=Lysobacter sp. Hz 25 TaxID=3383698 RepID=UPI0038D4A270